MLFLPHDSYAPGFFERRFNCGRRCSIDRNCTHCELVFDMTETLHDKGALIDVKQGRM